NSMLEPTSKSPSAWMKTPAALRSEVLPVSRTAALEPRMVVESCSGNRVPVRASDTKPSKKVCGFGYQVSRIAQNRANSAYGAGYITNRAEKGSRWWVVGGRKASDGLPPTAYYLPPDLHTISRILSPAMVAMIFALLGSPRA